MLAKITWNPSDRQLRQFAICALVALPLVGWFVLGRTDPTTWSVSQVAVYSVFATLALVGGLLAWLRPRALKLAFLGATLATMPIGMVIGELLLLIIFFGIFTPVALLFGLLGRDALNRRFEPGAASYWSTKSQPADVQQYFRQS
jgi:hypothetical protein